MTKKLVFVYNANSGFMSKVIDGLHKSFVPKTYQCQLCSLSYGRVSMKEDWKAFTDSLPLPVEFWHKDDLEREFPKLKASLPAVFEVEGSNITERISESDFAQMANLEDLKDSVKKII